MGEPFVKAWLLLMTSDLLEGGGRSNQAVIDGLVSRKVAHILHFMLTSIWLENGKMMANKYEISLILKRES